MDGEEKKKQTYLSTQETTNLIGVSSQTLRVWASRNKISFITTPGGQRRYDAVGFIEQRKQNPTACHER
jgi:excisionase family DNA binding protein